MSGNNNNKIKVAGDKNFPPYEFLEAGGIFKGFNVDIMNTISIYTGLEVEYVPMEWSEAVKALEEGSVDAVLGMAKSPGREKKFDFSIPILVNSRVLFTKRDNTKINSLNDLIGKKVALQKGDIAEEIIKKVEDVEVIREKTQYEALMDLVESKADAFIGNKYASLYFVKKNNLEKLVKIVNGPLSESDYCIAVKKGNYKLLGLINSGLERMKKDGVYNKIYEKWFGEEFVDVKSIIKRYLSIGLGAVSILIAALVLLAAANKKLNKMVAIKTKELIRANEELTATYEEISAQNEELIASYEELRASEQKVRELQERLMLALDASDTSVWEYNLKEKKFYITENIQAIIKNFKENNGYKSILRSIEKKDRKNLFEKIRQAYKGKIENIEVKVRVKSCGENKKYLLIQGKLIDDKITGVISDITELESYRKKLEFELERYRALFMNSRDGIIYYDKDKKITGVNPAFERIFGYSKEEILGKSIYDDVIAKKFKLSAKMAEKILNGERNFFTYEGIRYKNDGKPVFAKMKDIIVRNKNNEIVGAFSFYEDITEEKRYLEQLKALFNYSPDAIVLVDRNHKIVDINPAFERLFEYKKEECVGKDIDELLPGEMDRDSARRITNSVFQEESVSTEGIRYTKSGKPIYVTIKSILVKINEEIIGLYGIYTDITEIHEYRKKLEYMSLHDNLTGLYNRAFFEEELKRYAGSRDYPISIIMIDLNGLKLINDSLGHEKGDKLLRTCAEVLQRSIRTSDILARIGGDEFALLLPRTFYSDAEKIVKRIMENVEKYNATEAQDGLYLSLAIGFATAESDNINLKDVMKKADELMYRDKLLKSTSIRSQTLNVLLSVLAEKDCIIEGHTKRVKELCLKMGQKLGLPPKELSDLSIFAEVHDLGEVAISDSILNKKGPLTDGEWEIIKQHSEKGYRIALSSPDLAGIADLILKHHERWDGKGYPLGLKGKEIPLLCRILSVADAFDAMTSKRPYNMVKSVEEALSEIKRNAGTQFDPEIVEVFLSLFDKN
ncbi:MAG: PAS domain S-box protein [Thermovenabulum sp.]